MNNNNRRYWELEYANGEIITENQMEWGDAPKINIVRLTLHYDGKRWNVQNKSAYVQKKRGSVAPGGGGFAIESRSIGWYEDNKKIFYTVDEFTGQMKIEVKELNGTN